MNSNDVVIVVIVAVVQLLDTVEICRHATSARCGHYWSASLWASTSVGVGRRTGATPNNELIRQVQTCVMLHRQVVSVVAASGSVPRFASGTSTPHSAVNFRRLEEWLVVSVGGCGVDMVGGRATRQLEEEEKFIENVKATATDVTTCVMTHVTKYRLNCVTICIAFNIANEFLKTGFSAKFN